ncbi:MAG: HPr(Ser) kinase/phosphatase [Calditrichia bacterium]
MNKDYITVEDFYNEIKSKLKLRLANSRSGFDNKIRSPELHRPGLALAGFIELFTFQRIQVIGNTEIKFLNSLTPKERNERLKNVFEFEIPCMVVTDGNVPPQEMISIATKKRVPVFTTNHDTTIVTHFLSDFLQNKFAPQICVHGTLVDVYGIGILLTGRSGIGKSEIALDLIERGHRLVADDTVIITKKAEEILMGEATELAQNHLEIRGLGLIDIRRIFGIRAIRIHKRIELEINLVDFDKDANYDRTGLDDQFKEILGVKIPAITLPINPGKNITVIVETIALDFLLKIYGHHAAREFNERLVTRLHEKEKEHLNKLKMRAFLDKDFE